MELTREQITEGNVKLAKLLGWFQQDNVADLHNVWYEKGDSAVYVAFQDDYPHRTLPFHRDWNFLMKVVDKIGTIVYYRKGDDPKWNWKEHYSYGELFVNIFSKWLRNHFEEHNNSFNLMNDLTSIWCGCVAYVDWYELNKNEE